MIQNKALSLLSIATRGRNLVSGEYAVENAVKTGTAFLVIIGTDVSENTKKMFKLARYIKDGEHDMEAFNAYLEQIGKSEQEFLTGLTQSFAEVDIKQNEPQISVEQIADRTVKPWQLKGKNLFSKIVRGWNSKEIEQTGDDIDND